MNQVAIQEAANINFPMENFIGNWWAGAEHDVTPAGAAANGYKSLNMNRIGDLPVFDEIKTKVDGMEALSISNARMEALGMKGIGPEFTVSCQNHGGSGLGIVQQWDATAAKWTALTDYLESNKGITDPLIAEDSAAFAAPGFYATGADPCWTMQKTQNPASTRFWM